MTETRKVLHWLAHLFRMNTGVVETWHDEGRLMVGFRCDCGRIDGVHEAVLP